MANTAKTAAQRKAEAAMAKRAEQFRRREEALHEVIADYFDATEQAEKARAIAHAKADKIRAQAHERINALHTQAENAASDHEHRASRAINRMLELGESPKAVADTLGTPLTHVREIQRSTPQPPTTTPSTK
jgi:oligoendopeptidase F